MENNFEQEQISTFEIIDANKGLGTEKCVVIHTPGEINPDIFFSQTESNWIINKDDETYYAVKFPGKKSKLYTFYEIKGIFDELEKKECEL